MPLSAAVRQHDCVPNKLIPVAVALDDESNMAYLRLAAEGAHSVKQLSVATDEAGGELVIDIDADGRIVGIEVSDARSLLPDKILSSLSD